MTNLHVAKKPRNLPSLILQVKLRFYSFGRAGSPLHAESLRLLRSKCAANIVGVHRVTRPTKSVERAIVESGQT